jgi:hypothetical protein
MENSSTLTASLLREKRATRERERERQSAREGRKRKISLCKNAVLKINMMKFTV